jgi:hypothetical protein
MVNLQPQKHPSIFLKENPFPGEVSVLRNHREPEHSKRTIVTCSLGI